MVKKDPLKTLSQIQCILLDMDGTLYLGKKLLPGAIELIQWLEVHRIAYLLLTNNSSKNSRDYVIKLHKLGLGCIREEKIITSGEAACLYLKKKQSGVRVFILGTPALYSEFKRHGFITTDSEPEMVVLGFDTTLTYHKLWRFCDLVRSGLPYYATHSDLNCPTELGFQPDAGSTIAFIKASTGREPDVVIGKPNQPMLDIIEEKTGIPLRKTAMVGDRLYTDVAMGEKGIFTILTLSGETKKDDIKTSQFQPDIIVRDIKELISILDLRRNENTGP